MTELEYNELAEFKNLPLYDEDHALCSTVDLPEKEGLDGTIWLAVHEAPDLKTAQEFLVKKNLVPRGGIRYWDGEHKEATIFAYFWEKK